MPTRLCCSFSNLVSRKGFQFAVELFYLQHGTLPETGSPSQWIAAYSTNWQAAGLSEAIDQMLAQSDLSVEEAAILLCNCCQSGHNRICDHLRKKIQNAVGAAGTMRECQHIWQQIRGLPEEEEKICYDLVKKMLAIAISKEEYCFVFACASSLTDPGELARNALKACSELIQVAP